jgi:putative tricarboxylic transport membrane protein
LRRRELGAAVVLLAFGLFALSQALRLRFGSVAAPGPGFFPLCLAVAVCLASVGLLVRAWHTAPSNATQAGSGVRASTVVGTLGALLVYALVLEQLGFLLATFALLLFFFKALQRQRWSVAVGGSAVTSLVTYLVFRVWLGVNLPGGLVHF